MTEEAVRAGAPRRRRWWLWLGVAPLLVVVLAEIGLTRGRALPILSSGRAA